MKAKTNEFSLNYRKQTYCDRFATRNTGFCVLSNTSIEKFRVRNQVLLTCT